IHRDTPSLRLCGKILRYFVTRPRVGAPAAAWARARVRLAARSEDCYDPPVPNAFVRLIYGNRMAGWLIFLLGPTAFASIPSPAWFARPWQSEDRLPNNTVGG